VSLFVEKIEERFRNIPRVHVFRLAFGKNRKQRVIALGGDGYKDDRVIETIEIGDMV
jgi:hypothetical protein